MNSSINSKLTPSALTVIEQTKTWLSQVIIGLNFCPFAKKEFVNQTIEYHVSKTQTLTDALAEVVTCCEQLSAQPQIETSLIIYQQGFELFDDYLVLVDYANQLICDSGYEGIFQLASFHPQYCFAGEPVDDAANYTNRSPFPTLHIIREESLERAIAAYKHPELIPENNIALAREKGNHYFKKLLDALKQKG